MSVRSMAAGIALALEEVGLEFRNNPTQISMTFGPCGIWQEASVTVDLTKPGVHGACPAVANVLINRPAEYITLTFSQPDAESAV